MPLRRELHEAFILIANAAATVPSMTTGRRPVAISRRRARPRRGHSDVASTADRVLHELANGRLVHFPVNMRFWDGSVLRAGSVDEDRSVVVVDRRALAHVMREPTEIGLARAWVDGSLTVDGALEDVLSTRHEFAGTRLSIGDRVRLALAAVRVAGLGVLRRPPTPEIEASLSGRRHSLVRDRTAIRHHYDVSNEFYRLVLGPSMVYSCAYFTDEDDSLEQAQEHKLDLICRKLRLSAGDRFLDIGSGWGALVLHAAANYGVHATGITLSQSQAALARSRARQLGLEQRVDIRVADYREVPDGPFDKIASVGMYEHVGLAQLDEYVRTSAALLRPGGLFLNHGIARLASEAPASDTFISRYVFPDGELHPVDDLIASIRAAGLELRDVESLREHYPHTLRGWLSNLETHRAEALALVGAQRERAWRLYMTASAQAFEEGEITVYQVLAARRGAPHPLPLDRSRLLLD
jgi:cyclopropane-fatty-acyl-phospholipid synthase